MIITPQVLFVTNKDDFAIDFLIYKFKKYCTPYLRLNSEDITECDVNWSFGNDMRFKFNDYIYSLKDVKSVYFRRAPTIFPNSSNHNDTPYINRERRDFFEGLYLSLKAKWINPIFATYIAERKLFQLSIARNIGFDIPSTIVSNNSSEIKKFLDSHGKCIIKPISHGLQISKEGAFSIYTSELKDIDFMEKDKLFECPAFVQSRIKNHRDIRATVIGNEIFAVEIEKDKIEDVDWRTPDIVKSYKVHTLPNNIVELMYKLHKALDLVYSAFDFILTPEGEYYFLETNPAGEWVWLERELGLPISTAIINELIGL